jgi:hypothetical protein
MGAPHAQQHCLAPACMLPRAPMSKAASAGTRVHTLASGRSGGRQGGRTAGRAPAGSSANSGAPRSVSAASAGSAAGRSAASSAVEPPRPGQCSTPVTSSEARRPYAPDSSAGRQRSGASASRCTRACASCARAPPQLARRAWRGLSHRAGIRCLLRRRGGPHERPRPGGLKAAGGTPPPGRGSGGAAMLRSGARCCGQSGDGAREGAPGRPGRRRAGSQWPAARSRSGPRRRSAWSPAGAPATWRTPAQAGRLRGTMGGSRAGRHLGPGALGQGRITGMPGPPSAGWRTSPAGQARPSTGSLYLGRAARMPARRARAGLRRWAGGAKEPT